MKYFSSLPLITNTALDGSSYLLRNILIRTELIPSINKNPLLMYKYEIRENDTPETIANKYYGDSYRYWMVLYGNPTLMDPQLDWPLTSQQFTEYLKNKYATIAGGEDKVLSYTLGTVHHYEKIITTIDNNTRTKVIKNVEVDLDTYNLISPNTNTNTFSDGSSVTMTLSKNAVSIYNYENDKNEAKRSINLINSNYVNQLEKQYTSLVNI